jgi:hypothetical protein
MLHRVAVSPPPEAMVRARFRSPVRAMHLLDLPADLTRTTDYDSDAQQAA